jgi:hypothetical protein
MSISRTNTFTTREIIIVVLSLLVFIYFFPLKSLHVFQLYYQVVLFNCVEFQSKKPIWLKHESVKTWGSEWGNNFFFNTKVFYKFKDIIQH